MRRNSFLRSWFWESQILLTFSRRNSFLRSSFWEGQIWFTFSSSESMRSLLWSHAASSSHQVDLLHDFLIASVSVHVARKSRPSCSGAPQSSEVLQRRQRPEYRSCLPGDARVPKVAFQISPAMSPPVSFYRRNVNNPLAAISSESWMGPCKLPSL